MKKRVEYSSKKVSIAVLILSLCLVSCEKFYENLDPEAGGNPEMVLMTETLQMGRALYDNEEHKLQIMEQAQKVSDDLEAYIKDWHAGNAPAEIPEELKPAAMSAGIMKFTKLIRPEEAVEYNIDEVAAGGSE